MDAPIFAPGDNTDDRDTLNQAVTHAVSGYVQADEAGTSGKYGCFFVANRAYAVVGLSEVHEVAGTDANPVTVTVEKCASGIAGGAGVDVLSTDLSLKATAAIPQHGTLTTTKANLIVKKGDRLRLKPNGTLTAVYDVCLTVYLQEI